MTNFKALSRTVPPHDYQVALQGALSWLGKRYLLAEPLNRRPDEKTPPPGNPQRPAPSPVSAGA